MFAVNFFCLIWSSQSVMSIKVSTNGQYYQLPTSYCLLSHIVVLYIECIYLYVVISYLLDCCTNHYHSSYSLISLTFLLSRIRYEYASALLVFYCVLYHTGHTFSLYVSLLRWVLQRHMKSCFCIYIDLVFWFRRSAIR